MFLARDQRRPYTYNAFMVDLRLFLARVGTDLNFGPHGIRVEAYNRSKETNGEDLTVAHGLWKSSAHHRYRRFSMLTVAAVPANMVGAENPYAPEEQAAPRVVVRDPTLSRTGDGAGPSSAVPAVPVDEADGSDEDGVPPLVVQGRVASR